MEETPIAQAELAIPGRLLNTVKLWLARLEGVEPGDKVTAKTLAQAEGLEAPDDVTWAERKILEAVTVAFLGFRGDGSTSYQFFGKRVELPPEDRGLLILANLTSSYILENSQWGTTALLLAGNQEGIQLDNVIVRLKNGIGGILRLLQKLHLPIAEGEVEEAQEQIDAYCEVVTDLWGDSNQALQAKKSELELEVTEELRSRIRTTPRAEHILEIQLNLRDLSLIASGPLKAALENASQRLDQILTASPEILEGAIMPISPLGRVLALNQAIESIQLEELPQSRDEIVQQTIEAATQLHRIDYRALVLEDEVMLDQVRRRITVLRNVIVLIENHGGLYKLAQIRRREMKQFKRSSWDQRIPIYDPRPDSVASVLGSYANLKATGKMSDAAYKVAMGGECYAAAHAILEELKKDWEDARYIARSTIEAIQAGQTFSIDRRLERDDVALEILGVILPQDPTQQFSITQRALDVLQLTLERTPDPWDLSISLRYLGWIFQGDKVENDDHLAKTEVEFLSLLRGIVE
jgi:hypothetical protein